MRGLVPLLLALVLSVTSVTSAVARAEQGALTQMVICSMGAERLVTVDARGQPVERAHHCPDCLAALSALPRIAPAERPVTRVTVVVPPGDRPLSLPPRGHGPVLARGPPVVA